MFEKYIKSITSQKFHDDAIFAKELASLTRDYVKAKRVLAKVALKKTDFAIFPYGKLGKMTEDILLEMGIPVKYRFKNKNLSGDTNVYPLKTSADIDTKNVTLLLCSSREDIFCELRQEAFSVFSFEHVVDVFSPSMYYDEDSYFDRPYFSKDDTQYPRRTALEKLAKEIYINKISGAVAEVGVFRGDFANSISKMFPDRTQYLFDTFQGFDDRDVDSRETEWSGHFRSAYPLSNTSVETALSNIPYLIHTKVKKGYFPDTAQGLENEKFAFVSLDTDLYKPIYTGLKFFWPRMTPGGYIFVDDLGHSMLPGVRNAVLDFCKEEHCGYVSIDDGWDATAVLAKPL